MDIKKYALIVAGGKGLRMGSDLPKQFLPIAGKPVLMHTIEAFFSFDAHISIILVLPKEHVAYWNKLVREHSFGIEHKIVHGGAERFFSVKNGLNHIAEKTGLVAIHDGVRPLVNKGTLQRCFDNAQEKGSAIPCIPVYDSVRIEKETNNTVFPRDGLRLVQTPQTFQLALLKDAYDIVFTPDITDDASVLEKQGHTVNLVQGNRENIKITSKEDLAIAEALFNTTQLR